MQVSKTSDSVTHAVIGNVESVEMGVSDSAALMHIFSTTLYTYPMLATVREIICNGWDGHITAGCTDKPLQISIDEEEIVIRDFGPGIPHEKIGPIYGVFGNSTKRDDGSVTGGFGLGSKAPFSYTDNFEVVSNHNGLKSVYRVSKSSMEKGGKPTIDTMVQITTDDTGIQVTIPLKSGEHYAKFFSHINEVLVLGGIKAEVNGNLVDCLPTEESPSGYIISSFAGTLTSRINVRYGNVVYPVPRMDAYHDMWDQVNKNMSQLWDRANITFLAPPNSISIAPSREALIFTDGTVNQIKQLLSRFNPADATVKNTVTKQLTNQQVNKLLAEEPPVNQAKFMEGDLFLPKVQGACNEHSTGIYAFFLRKAAIAYAISKRGTYVRGEGKVLIKRFTHVVNRSETVDKVLAKRLFRACRLYEKARTSAGFNYPGTIDTILQGPLARYVTAPLVQAVKANEQMDRQLLFYADQKYAHSGEVRLADPARKVVGSALAMMSFAFKRVLLARSKTAIKQFFDNRRWQLGDRNADGWVVYQLPKNEKHYDSIRQTFKDLGYEIHEYLHARKVAEKIFDPNAIVEPKEKKVSPKRKGYLSLHSARNLGEFTLSTARKECKPDEHITDPLAYVVLNSGSKIGCFSEFASEISEHVWKLWGKQIAVVTPVQVQKLKDKGVPEVSKFVTNYVDEKLSSAPDFPRYLALGRFVAQVRNQPYGEDGVIRYMLNHPEITEQVGKNLRFAVSAETETLITFFEDRTYNGISTKLPKCNLLASKVKQSPMLEKLRSVLKNSEWAPYVDLDRVSRQLKRSLPGDANLKVPYTIVREMLKEGFAQ